MELDRAGFAAYKGAPIRQAFSVAGAASKPVRCPNPVRPMFDIRWIRDNPAAFDAGMAQRGLGPQSGALLDLDGERREVQTKLQELQTRRNEASKAIGAAKAKGGDAASLIDEVASLKDALREGEAEIGRASCRARV